AAGRGRALALPRSPRARREADPDPDAHRARRRDRSHRRARDGRRRLPDEALRVARAARAHPRRAAPHADAAAEPRAGAPRGAARLRRLDARHPRATPGRRARDDRLADGRRVPAAARAARSPAPPPEPGSAVEPDTGPRRRRLRSLDRPRREPPAPAAARGRARAPLHQDRAERGLRLLRRRRGSGRHGVTLWPRTLFGRVAGILFAGLVVAHGLTFAWILHERADLGASMMLGYVGRDIASSVAILD